MGNRVVGQWHGGFASSSGGPAGVLNAKAWWDVSALTLANLAEITALTDLSGSGNHAALRSDMAGATVGPTCMTAIQNGLRVARFDGTKKNIGKAFYIDGPGMTIILVYSTREAQPFTTRKNICGFGNAVTVNINTNLLAAADKFEAQAPASGTLNGAVSTINTFHVLSLGVPTASLPDGGFYVDGTLLFTLTRFNNPPFDMGGLAVGGSLVASNQNAGDLGEIVVYPRLLSTVDRQSVEAYLKAKWATP